MFNCMVVLLCTFPPHALTAFAISTVASSVLSSSVASSTLSSSDRSFYPTIFFRCLLFFFLAGILDVSFNCTVCSFSDVPPMCTHCICNLHCCLLCFVLIFHHLCFVLLCCLLCFVLVCFVLVCCVLLCCITQGLFFLLLSSPAFICKCSMPGYYRHFLCGGHSLGTMVGRRINVVDGCITEPLWKWLAAPLKVHNYIGYPFPFAKLRCLAFT